MARTFIFLPVCLALLAVSCSRKERSQSPVETGQEQSTASGEFSPAIVPSQTPTIALAPLGASEYRRLGARSAEPTTSTPIRGRERVEHLPDRVAIFDSVFWDPRDTVSLRHLIAETNLVKGKSVLEIGTGSGLLSLYCLKFGASKVVATDVNPMAVKNARYNAEQMGLADRFEVRQVPLDDAGAYSVIDASERFDLIISNPPWENSTPQHIADYAFYDPQFNLLRSLVGGLPEHLNADGSALLAYGCVDGIRYLRRLCTEEGLRVLILDDRNPEALPPVFVPGMLLEVCRDPANDVHP